MSIVHDPAGGHFIDLTTLPLPLLAIGLKPGEVLHVVGKESKTVLRCDEEGVLAANLLHQVRGVGQLRVWMSSAEVRKDIGLVKNTMYFF